MKLEERIKEYPADVIETLIAGVLAKKNVEIHFDYAQKDQWSIITTHQEDDDTELSLRLHAEDHYDLYVGYYDEEDEFNEIIHPLSIEEKKLVPERLKKVMKKVLDDEEGMRVPASLLAG